MATKKGGAKAAVEEKELKKVSDHDISVRIHEVFNDSEKKLRATASINIGKFAVHGFKIYESEKGIFAQMPSTKIGKEYKDIFHPVTAESRIELLGKLTDAYHQKLEQAQNKEQDKGQDKNKNSDRNLDKKQTENIGSMNEQTMKIQWM